MEKSRGNRKWFRLCRIRNGRQIIMKGCNRKNGTAMETTEEGQKCNTRCSCCFFGCVLVVREHGRGTWDAAKFCVGVLVINAGWL